MPKYWEKQIFTHGSFPEVGQKQKTEKRKRRGPNNGNNNGQLRIANAKSASGGRLVLCQHNIVMRIVDRSV